VPSLGGASFFSEEKKQKTFTLRPWPGCMEAMVEEQKFFASFFSKKKVFLCPPMA
jgi:hypothetical protein